MQTQVLLHVHQNYHLNRLPGPRLMCTVIPVFSFVAGTEQMSKREIKQLMDGSLLQSNRSPSM